jgi:glycosyltransferase involved in cell wall biosynthesis
MIPDGQVVCYSVLNPELKPEIPAETLRIPIKIVDKPKESWGFNPKFGLAISFVMETFTEVVYIPSLSRDIADFARIHHVDAIWCILEGQTMIRLARKVAKLAKLPLYTHIWDTPGWWMRGWKVNAITSRKVIAEYEKAISQSVACGVASWAMKEEYEKSFGVKCVPLVAGLEKSMAMSPSLKPNFKDGEVHIGLAGQIYARDTWDAFIAALDSINWLLNGRQVKVKVLGQWLDPILRRPSIDFLGWHSQEETVEILSQMDILYAPYWFDALFEQEARFSFPSKITTYLAAGRPVFFHGPEYSSPGKFLAKHHAGVCCYSRDEATIVEQFSKILSNEEQYQTITHSAHRAFMESLSFDVLKRNLYDFLPIHDGQNE